MPRKGYKYSRYIGEESVRFQLRLPSHLYEQTNKASLEARKSVNKMIFELLEREFGEKENTVS